MASNVPVSDRPLPRRRPFVPPTAPSSASPAQSSAGSATNGTAKRPPTMPTRSPSRLTGGPPFDAAKPDDQAVDDVIEGVKDTGSIERAARKLELYAKLNGGAAAASSNVASSLSTGKGKAVEDDSAVDDGEEDEDEDALQEMSARREDGDKTDVEEIVHLQEIVEGLWVGDLVAAMDSAGLDERGITNIVSLLRPRLSFPPHFSVLPIEIDDSPDTDILSQLPTCVAWIGEALRKREQSLLSSPLDSLSVEERAERDLPIRHAPLTSPGGVLIHCQAGMSRSATVAAAYLITALDIDPTSAVDIVRDHRPVIDPSTTFLHQLGIFHDGAGKVTLRDRSTRHFYMERNAQSFMNGQTSSPALDKMAKYPATPTPSAPATPSGGMGRRKIRCKTCRRFLAVREHMMDHILDQAPLSRPRTPSNFALPALAHRLSMSSVSEDIGVGGGISPRERRGSMGTVSDVINPLTGRVGARSRQPSMSIPSPSEGMVSSPLSPLSPMNESGSVPFPRASTPGLVLKGMEPIDSTPNDHKRAQSSPATTSSPTLVPQSGRRPYMTPEQLAASLPPHLQALRSGSMGGSSSPALASPVTMSPPSSPEKETSSPISGFGSAPDMARSASRRKSMLSMTPADKERRPSSAGSMGMGFGGELASTGTPILVNQKCSGYFVEPLTWMEPILKSGQISGKIVCPNEKCGAKIGNYDWAGVQCGCKEWVTPGFCISRSKVDEVW